MNINEKNDLVLKDFPSKSNLWFVRQIVALTYNSDRTKEYDDKVSIEFELTDEQADALEKLAAEQGMTVDEYINRAIETFGQFEERVLEKYGKDVHEILLSAFAEPTPLGDKIFDVIASALTFGESLDVLMSKILTIYIKHRKSK